MMNSERIGSCRAPGVHLEFAAEAREPQFKTGVPVFVGFGERIKDKGRPWLWVDSWRQFEQSAAIHLHQAGCLRHAVRGFFENGGEFCAILPLPETGGSLEMLAAPFRDADDAPPGPRNEMHGVLEDIDDVDLVCVPDLMMESLAQPLEAVSGVQQLVLEHCRKMGDRFAILDSFPDLNYREVEELIRSRRQIRGGEGALYFPWIKVCETEKPVPPCGHVAGIYARTDAKWGVFKSPANEVLEGAVELAASLTQNEITELNRAGINCIRSFPSRGIRVWGARTLSGHSADQYITTRRLISTLVRWTEKNMSDLVYETHDESLWRRIRHRMEGYCYELFQKGALKGRTPEDAYFVKCDRELNTWQERELGLVISEVGLACVAPAEYVVVRIMQSPGGASATLVS